MEYITNIIASNILSLMVFFLIVFFGVLGAEYYLASKASPAPGLVIPIIFFALSILLTLSSVSSALVSVSPVRALGMFLAYNITTALLAAAYVCARRKRRIPASPAE
jgi:hypothetical protein